MLNSENELSVRLLDRSSDLICIDICAKMMAQSSPWLLLSFSYSQCRNELQSEEVQVRVIEKSNEIVGFMATNSVGIEGEPLLVFLCVREDVRGCGLGSYLLDFFEQHLFPKADNLYLFVSDINPRARALYERRGFVRTGELTNYNFIGQTEYLYRLTRRPRQHKVGQQSFVRQTHANEQSMVSNTLKSTLTSQQNDSVDHDCIDLANGYPNLAMDSDVLEEGHKFAVETCKSGTSHTAILSRLERTMCQFLGIHKTNCSSIRLTSTGTNALFRSVSAICRYAVHCGYSGTTFIIPDYSIDIYHQIISEYRDTRVVSFPRVPIETNWIDILNSIVDAESHLYPGRKLAIILDSPSNPFGQTVSRTDMLRLVSHCEKYRVLLLLDHCFLKSGLHYPDIIASIFSEEIIDVDWIGIWDTGKTFDVFGDKLAVIASNGGLLGSFIDVSLNVMHSSIGFDFRSVAFFDYLLRSDYCNTYLNLLATSCKTNLTALMCLDENQWAVQIPNAGTVVCVARRQDEWDSEMLRHHLLSVGVSSVSGTTFRAGSRFSTLSDKPFIRLSLARNPAYFSIAVDRIASIV